MIDCDVHQNFNHIKDLVPWLDPQFREYVLTAGYDGFSLPTLPWLHIQGFMRNETYPADGGVPGSDFELLREQALESRPIEYAVLNGEEILFISSIPQRQIAAALATAYNRWLTEEWLPRDPRLKGSLVVATQDPVRAAEDIRAFGDHPDVIQVLLPSGATAGYGDERYHPIYEAAIERGLAVALHPSNDGVGIFPPPTPAGYPPYYVEWHTLLPLGAMTHLVSLVCHGAFEKYPELRFAFVEEGFTWLPSMLWRLDSNWKALRAEAPWVRRLPSDTVREHMRFATQPIPEPPDGRALHNLLGSFDGFEDMLIFATDYPHWDGDEPHLGLRRFPKEWRAKIESENARAFYRLPERQVDTPTALAHDAR